MGNSPPTGGLGLANVDSYEASLGGSVAIHFHGREVQEDIRGGERIFFESWAIAYKIGATSCSLSLSKIFRNSHPDLDERLEILILDNTNLALQGFRVSLRKYEACLLIYDDLSYEPLGRKVFKDGFINDTANAYGAITLMAVDIYGDRYASPTTMALEVREQKRRSEDTNPYMATVTHYYVNTRVEVALSVAVKGIRVLHNGKFDFTVDGPERHPTSALLNMFDEVLRTKTWKPTYCPHCAGGTRQRQRAGVCQSESENGDGDNGPPPPPQRSIMRNPRSLMSNSGRFQGDKNGNINICPIL